MGTSKSNSGPGNGSPLLPSWASSGQGDAGTGGGDSTNDGDGSNNSDTNGTATGDVNQAAINSSNSTIATGKWNTAKGSMGRFANGTGSASAKSTGRSYVRAYGGARNATRAAYNGISFAVALGSALAKFPGGGATQTLNDFGLQDCIGKDADYVLKRLVDEIAPTGSTSDEAIAREAMVQTIASLVGAMDLENKPVDALDQLSESNLKTVILDFIREYIFAKCCYEIGVSIENKNITTAEIIAREAEMKRFISSAVNSDFGKVELLQIDLNDGTLKEIVTEIVEQAYIIIGK